jgi:RNA polymerase sigma factor (sigma-70 family)
MSSGPLTPVLQHLRTLTAEERSDRELLEAFTRTQDHAAFATLVERHGPTVMRVCRRVLPRPEDAEDAFQATFLVFARKAGSIRKTEAVLSWLHGVAYRAAMSAKRNAARRRQREGQAKAVAPADPSWQAAWREVQGLLEDEIQRLPSRYRSPFLLCCIEGRGHADVADQLALKLPTLRTRLSKARKRLKERLARRGVVLSVVLATLALSKDGSVLGADLLTSTAEGAVRYATGSPVQASLVSASAVALAKGVTKAMFLTRLQTALILVLCLGLAAGIAAYSHAQPVAAEPDTALKKNDSDPARPVEQKADPDRDIFTYAGRVLTPDGKPLAGAKVVICGLKPGHIEFRERATSGPDGTFRFRVRRDEFGDKGVVPLGRSPPERQVHIGATADGYGAACVWAGQPDEREHLTLWLPAEEVVHGRIMSLEGRPIAGVQVSAMIRSSRAAKDHRPLPFDAPDTVGYFSGNVLPYDWERTSAVSDKDGRFTLRGLGRGWLYDLSIIGPTVVNGKALLVARPEKPTPVSGAGISPPDRPPPQMIRYGSTFTYVAPPCKPVFGVVRDKKTGKPLAGFDVRRPWTRDDDPQAWATTDKDGRYRMTGLPSGVHTLKVDPPANTPYLAAEFRVIADQPGVAPVQFDMELERQPAVTGRVTDRATGKPLQAWVEYRPLARNPNLKKDTLLAQPGWGNHPPSALTDRDGRFTLPVLPGPGVLLANSEGDYLPARLARGDRITGVADRADPELIDCRPLLAWPAEYHVYRLIDVADGKDVEANLVLTPGARRPLVIEFPDGRARETTVLGLKPATSGSGDPYDPGKSAIVGLAPDEVRRLFVSTYDSSLAATAVVSGKESGPVRMKLRPTGTITGHVVDKDGKPIPDVSFLVFFDDGPGRPGVFVHGSSAIRAWTPQETQRHNRTRGYYEFGFKYSRSEKTDNLGRFRLPGVLPDVAFELQVRLIGPPNAKGQRFITGDVPIARSTIKPGATRDLGDLRAVAPPKK